MYDILKSLHARFDSYCCQLHVLEFNGAKYDVNMTRSYLEKALNMHDTTNTFVVKKGRLMSAYPHISVRSFRNRATNNVAPGSSYS